MRAHVAGFAFLLAFTGVPALAQGNLNEWAREFPAPSRVIRDVANDGRGGDQLDIAARQRGVLYQLYGGLSKISGTLINDPDGKVLPQGTTLSPAVQSKRRAYWDAIMANQNTWYPRLGGQCGSTPRPLCKRARYMDTSSEIQGSREYAEQLAARYFSPGLRAEYVAAIAPKIDDPQAASASTPATDTSRSSSGLGLMFWALAILAAVIWLWRRGKKDRPQARMAKNNHAALLQFGATVEERAQAIDTAFDKRDTSVKFQVDGQDTGWKRGQLECEIGRSIGTMSPREREALRAVFQLCNAGLHSGEVNVYYQRLGIIYGDGKATVYGNWKTQIANGGQYLTVNQSIERVQNEKSESAINSSITDLNKAIQKNPDHPLLKSLAARLFGTGGDLAPSDPLKPVRLGQSPSNGLILGVDVSDADKVWTFDGEGSLITVAPPGSGKTQCHVIPNLLTWRGPAVVLDIKGEIFEKTSGWRAANVGPIYKFSPLDPDNSHAYNPLTVVSSEPDHIWEDSRFVADMMIVPSSAKDPFWESKARDVLTAAVAHVAYSKPPEQRTMSDVLDILHGVAWDRFIISLTRATDVPTMARSGRSLGEMEAKTRDGVLQSALTSLSAWEGARIARATARSDWQPTDLRSGKNPTVYICINPNEIDSYASLLRVVIAQHIRSLTAKLPERGGLPILFILDELPRLRHMPPVEEALEIGRQYGIKLWMFAQSLGQLENAYDNAEGMVGSCALRMFMNPSLHDETAQKLSDDMGYRESVIDGTRVKCVEPQVLAGADFKDAVIVMASNAAPARVNKHFAYADPELSARMAVQPTRS